MLSIDTNILVPATDPSNVLHVPATEFLASLDRRTDVVISELVLIEFYVAIRNPVVHPKPLDPADAVAACQAYRNHPRWGLVDLPGDSRAFHDALWERLAEPALARRRVYDARIALSLVAQGVDEFATRNVRDFEGLGFRRVWDPLGPAPPV